MYHRIVCERYTIRELSTDYDDGPVSEDIRTYNLTTGCRNTTKKAMHLFHW